ncbi:MAG: isoleucine--tRNA ligase, partial [Thermoplasmata archaeon]|nr:isoleucine--tRNA ligase [Thermoplasmata archaeon]
PPRKEYDPNAISEKINDFWVNTHAYKRTKKSKSEGKKFYFVDGPPFTAGKFHLGLARNKILKDSILRFQRSQGLDVMDRPGYDMHGLPIEVKVEEMLGITNRNDIEELGIERFVETCNDYANDFKDKMTEQFIKLGIWMDWEKPFLSTDPAYIESIWWSIKEAHKKDLLRKTKMVTGWCPRCETPLAQGEIVYKEKIGHSAYIKIPIKGRRDEYIIVWSTTPWTFAGALAVAVNPDLVYARVSIRQGGRKSTIIVLEDRVEEIASIANIEAYEIVGTVSGRELEGLEFFHPLMADIQFHKSVEGEWAQKIIGLDTVHDSHTGAVYLAPGFGHYDYEAAMEFGLPIFSPIDERGIFTTEVGIKHASQNVDEASDSILADLKGIRFVLHDSMEPHTYGHCWRCESPIIHRSTEQWFLRVNDVKDIMLKTLKSTTWQPEEYMVRQHDWIKKTNDWCISRQRYWGTPMPLWECITDVCGHMEVVDSLKSLKDSGSYDPKMKLHRPWIDNINLECPKCGGLMKRVPDIVDVWFDSSVASWAQLGYPRKKKPFKELWPADFIAEGQGQTKGWFQNQMTAGVMLFNKMPFQKALVHGWLYDENGQSISDSDAESSDPDTVIGLYGADALRFYLLKMEPWKNDRFNTNDVKRAYSTLNILWNSYVFASTYMSMDDWDPKEHKFSKVKKNFKPEDQWLISRIESLTNNVKNEMDAMNTHKACQLIEKFITKDLSHWYIRIIRERMWQEGDSKDKEAAFVVLHETLNRLAIVSSPFIPYIAETIYQELDGTELSVSIVPWTEIDATRLAEGMEKNMRNARTIVETANKLRQENGLQIRWPVRKMTISASSEEVADAVNMYKDIIMKQTNIKELELVPENQEWEGQELTVVPNPNVIGKAYRQWESKIARMLKVLPARDVKAKIETGDYTLGIEGQVIRILPSMVNFETKLPDGVVAKEFPNGTMYFDTSLDDKLTAEGFARQITRRIQEMRKEMALDPEEYIKLSVSMSDGLLDILDEHLENIADSTRANQMEIVEELGDEDYVVEWPIEYETVTIGITSLNIKKSMDEFTGIKGVDNELALAMVDAGITDSQVFIDTDRELLLKIPGMSHSTLRKIKEYIETPEDLREADGDQRCPLCDGIVEPGATNCHRCGKNLVGDDDMDIQLLGDFEDEEEDEYYEEVVKEKVKVKKKKPKLEPELPPQPEDEIIKMATGGAEEEELAPEDLIASEIMSSLDEDEETLESKGIYVPAPEELEIMEEELPPPQKTVEDDLPPQVKEELEPKESIPEPEELPAEQEEPSQPPEESEELPVATKGDIIDSDMDKSIDAMAEAFELKHSVAKALYKGGYDSMESLESASEDDLRAVKGVGKKTARRIKQKLSTEETKMCSLCNAIVPAGSPVCERCNVRFVSEDEEEARSKEKYMSTMNALDKKLKKKPSDAKLLHSKAMTLIDAGKEDEALVVIEQGLETAPENKKLLKARDSLMKSEEDMPEPEKEYQETPEAMSASESEGKKEASEKDKPVEEGIKLKSSFTYLIPEERSAKTYKYFKQSIDQGMAGYCVTRTFPEKVREKYQLGETPILWLSNVAKEDAVRPKDLEKLSLSLEEFLSSQGGVVLLDGIEYLITNNNFITVLKLIQSLRDQVAINRSIMLLSVNPSTMDDHQINLLRREVDAVID